MRFQLLRRFYFYFQRSSKTLYKSHLLPALLLDVRIAATQNVIVALTAPAHQYLL
ncbi:hypothetical protein EBME_1708 [bacterium endosymbiont of Mortierella elongata FMR23-6]|nr:hypothetical protein EBME_1708 [bacterium endosymbiont of Mortierella elongata FMR23-6]